jgi:phospholipase A1
MRASSAKTAGSPFARHGALLTALLALWMHGEPARAQLAACAAIADDRERLACYDALAGRTAAEARDETERPRFPPELLERHAATQAASELEKQWELRPDLRQGTFRLLPYRPLYALIHATSNINNAPASPTHPPPVQDVALERTEAKFQLSFKTKLAQDILGSATDLWFGYTQQSYWQVANTRYSSPFRETNYQPEAVLVRPIAFSFGGVHLRYLGASFTHESNGRSEALSRSWNRIIGEAAFESGPWSLQLRPWAAVGSRSDNPDIADFVGRAEMIGVYRAQGQVVTLTARHTLRGGDNARGSARFDWAFPLSGNLNGHLQIFSGYGESLIDYNHRQTTLGVGVSFFD